MFLLMRDLGLKHKKSSLKKLFNSKVGSENNSNGIVIYVIYIREYLVVTNPCAF